MWLFPRSRVHVCQRSISFWYSSSSKLWHLLWFTELIFGWNFSFQVTTTTIHRNLDRNLQDAWIGWGVYSVLVSKVWKFILQFPPKEFNRVCCIARKSFFKTFYIFFCIWMYYFRCVLVLHRGKRRFRLPKVSKHEKWLGRWKPPNSSGIHAHAYENTPAVLGQRKSPPACIIAAASVRELQGSVE